MDSRTNYLVFQKIKRSHQNGKTIKDAGAHMYHAATGVIDGNEANNEQRDKIKKAFARYRGFSGRDIGTHQLSNEMSHKGGQNEG